MIPAPGNSHPAGNYHGNPKPRGRGDEKRRKQIPEFGDPADVKRHEEEMQDAATCFAERFPRNVNTEIRKEHERHHP